VHGSINLPAQSLYPTIPALYTLFSTAGVKNVIWFCSKSAGFDRPNVFRLPITRIPPYVGSHLSHVPRITFASGSSKGRGTRAAGWFADHIRAQNDTTIESSVLEGGIKGWVAAGPEYVELTDGYDASVWKPS
jgi:arsenical-resistance protein 2